MADEAAKLSNGGEPRDAGADAGSLGAGGPDDAGVPAAGGPDAGPAADGLEDAIVHESDVKARRKKRRKRSLGRFVRRQISRVRKLALCAEGFSLKGAQTWIRRVNVDWRRGDYPARALHAAHKAGFSAAQVERFGIDLAQCEHDLSEREYDLLYPMSGRYAKWVDDRVTARIVAGPQAGCLEPQHVNLIWRNGTLLYVPLSEAARTCAAAVPDEPELEPGAAWFVAFVRERAQALVPGVELRVGGSAWRSKVAVPVRPVPQGFALGSKIYTRRAFLKHLRQLAERAPLVLYERAPEDASWAELPQGARGSVRLIVCNSSGTNPAVVDAGLMIFPPRVGWHALEQADPPLEVDVDAGEAEELDDAAPEDVAAMPEAEAEEAEEAAAAEEAEEAEGAPRLRFHVAQIDIATGAFDGARAMYSRGRFADGPCYSGTEARIVGAVPHWEQIVRSVEALMRRIPQVEFVEVSVRSWSTGYAIVGMNSHPTFNRAYPLPRGTQRYLKQRAADKRELSRSQALQRVNHAAFLRLRRAYTKTFWPKGMVFYQGIRYPQDVVADLFSRNGIPLGQKLWAYRHGFLSYRLELYPELGPDTWQEFVTDVEYRWLRHINPKYRTWMEDKITYTYLLARHAEHLPAYYFYTSARAGQNRFLPMMDCPEGFEASVEGILRLARAVGTLALKPDEGSHGEGFYRLSYEEGAPGAEAVGADAADVASAGPAAADPDAATAAGPATAGPDAAAAAGPVGGRYLLNGKPATPDQIAAILLDPANQYLVTECIESHPVLRRIYPGAVGTVRVTVFKRDGLTPQIGNAYLRIGAVGTGGVDNVVAGGFVAEVDVATGAFGQARTLAGNRIVYQDVHPDTGERMEGVLPHWGLVRREVLAMAADIPQLEYLGFDVAITAEGFKLLEVNRYPDYPRISRLTPETMGYLLMKIDDKYRALDIEHDRSLFKLPRRDRRVAGGADAADTTDAKGASAAAPADGLAAKAAPAEAPAAAPARGAER